MLLYEKFGLDGKMFKKERFDFFFEMLEDDLSKTPEDGYHYTSSKSGLVFFTNMIGFSYYMIDQKDKIEPYVSKIFDYSLDFFFGDWRKNYHDRDKLLSEEQVKKNEYWVDYYRESILWASVLGRWDAAAEISGYPDKLCMETCDESKERKAWYIVFASYLRDGSLDNAGEFLEIVEQGRRRREKILLAVLRAIISGDSKTFDKEFAAFLKYCKIHVFSKRDNVFSNLSIDGTIMLNLAKHKGLQVEFPQEYTDHYIYL